jgi:predicted amidohydrolase
MKANRLTVAVVQWRFAWAGVGDAWENQWARLIGQAAARGAQLVVLPAHAGDALLARQYPELAHMSLRLGLAQAWRSTQPNADRAVQGKTLWQAYHRIFGHLAAQHRIVLAAGSLLLPDERDDLYHQAFLFDAQGEVRGVQRACHRTPAERALGVLAGDRLDVFETPAGTLGLIVGEDLYHPEVARVLTRQGADVLMAPTQRRFAGEAGLLAGLWRDVQGNQVFGLEACLVGDEAVPAQGLGSHILCPAELTGDTRGVVAAAATGTESELAVGELDRAARQALLARYDITRYFNRQLYTSQLLEAYP